MAIATSATIQQFAGLEAAIAERAAVKANAAERDCRNLLGKSKTDPAVEEYDRIIALNDGTEAEQAEYDTLLEAESLLCVAYYAPAMNFRPTDKGGVVASVGFDANRQEFVGIGSLKAFAQEYRRQAHSLLSRFTDYDVDGRRITTYVL